MGLDILTPALKKYQQNLANANLAGWLAISSLLCLEEFLSLLFLSGILAEFKAALLLLISTVSAQIAILEVLTAELEAINSIIGTFINTFTSALAAAEARLALFPFANPLFLECPIVQSVEEAIASILPAPTNPFAKLYKGTLADINLLQYQLLQNKKSILKYNQKIAQLQASVLAWQAIVDAIAAQFHV